MSKDRRVALLRGVNVGGKNKVLMRELCTVFGEAGCHGVESYIQSGNVVFDSSCQAEDLQKSLARAIEARFGFAVPVVVRTSEQMREALAANPFSAEGVAEERLAVLFLREAPTGEGLLRLEAKRFLPERFAVIGSEIYVDMPNGAGQTKLTTNYFDGRLKTVATARNLRTIRRLLEMAASRA